MMNCSVVITHYNKEALLLKAIASAVREVEDGDEIIVVDDCSSELVARKTLDEAMVKYPRLSFFTNERNRGSSYTKDRGIRKSKNDIIMLLDGDDVFPEGVGAIAKVKKKFMSDESLSFVFGDYISNDLVTGISNRVDCGYMATPAGLLSPYKVAKAWGLLGSSPFKRKAYFELGGFDFLYPKTDDADFHRRAILQSYRFGYVNEVIYTWNLFGKGESQSNSKKVRDSCFSVLRNAEFYFQFLTLKGFFQLSLNFSLFLLRERVKAIKRKILK